MSDSPAVSFEFFPPSDAAVALQLWQAVQRLAVAAAQIRLGDLRRGRLDARAHARLRAAHFARNRPRGRAALDLRECEQAASARGSQQIIGAQACGIVVALRGDAPEGAQGPFGAYAPFAGGFAYASDLVRGLNDRRAVRDFGGGLSGRPSRDRRRRGRHREPAAQSRCRRQSRDHPVLFRCRHVSTLSRPLRERGALASTSCRESCRSRDSRRC